ncbi:MAG: metallophosphoesterase [Clostridiales bacterium]|nr:metallophosphoesterase [Clostridiales bacterium]
MKKKLAFILSVVLVFALLTGSFPLSAFAKISIDKTLKFGSDGKFTILQIADIQDGPVLKSITKQYLKEVVKRVQPDLIVLSGDNIAGKYCKSGIKSVEKMNVRSAIDDFMSIFEKAGIPTAMVFGNHDAECGVTKEEQMAIYNSYSCSLGVDEGEDIDGCGTYNLPILSSDGRRTAYNIWMFDSNMYEYDSEGNKLGYGHVTQSQLDWYVNKSSELKAANGGEAVPSILFQHIVVPEIYDAFLEVPEDTEGAVEYLGKYYVLNPENTVPGSALHEYPGPSYSNSGEFQCIKKQGDVAAMFFGHDHANSYSVRYQGIDLVCTPGIGFKYYGDCCRGARVIELDEKDLSTYSTHVETFLSYYGDQPDMMLRYKTYRNLEISQEERTKSIILYICLFPLISAYRLFRNIFIK